MIDVQSFVADVQEYILRALKPLNERLKALESRPEVKGLDGKDGQDGRDGKDGVDGAAGRDGADCDMGAVYERLGELVKALPLPKDGVNGKDGRDGVDGMPGKDAEPVSEAAIADAVAARFERRFSDLTLSWERQVRDETRKALDSIPAPQDGKDGRDALPLDSIEITQDERTVTFKLGDVVRTITLDTVLDRGVWTQGTYEKGDAVSYGGSLWIAQEATEDAPGTSKMWRLAVKKGRDGKDLRDSASTHDGQGVTV